MTKTIAFLMPAWLLSGCAMLSSNPTTELGLQLEKQDSRLARIAEVHITSTDSGFWVRGNIQRRLTGKGPIYGHLHIDLLDGEGYTLASAITKPTRLNRNSRRARFAESFDGEETAAKTETVRITHHAQRHSHT